MIGGGSVGTRVKLSDIVAPAFFETHTAICNGEVNEVIEKGGRGSTKSSYVSVELILQLTQHPQCHAVVVRKVQATLRDSVFTQIKWAIDALALTDKFSCKVSPMEITYKPTGQKIYFRGLDDPAKLKSIKPPFGYIGIMWVEEMDQLAGESELSSIRRSVLRGGEYALLLGSFNPPAMARNWANRYALIPRTGKLVHHSTYLTVPRKWLGTPFFDQAEHQKETNPMAYRHEMLGEIVGNGTQVFDNLRLEPIPAQLQATFGEPINGVDWGWYPDPWAYNRAYYDAARRTLYIFDELTRNKVPNQDTAELVAKRIPQGELIIADSAEQKSVADYRAMGLRCIEAQKGPGSVNQSMKWLQSLAGIVIDPVKCPDTAKEFGEYEYLTGREGEVLSGYPDCNNHHIDAVRYATNRIWTRRGT